MTPEAAPGISQAIQFALAPAFLLVGVGSLLNVLTARLARVIDRARFLEGDVPDADRATQERELKELGVLDRRMTLAHWAIDLCTATALLVCFVIIVLFGATFIAMDVTLIVSLLFIAAMLCLSLGLVLFLIEVTVATNTVKVRDEFVRRRSWRAGRRRRRGG
jgi:hypothetical protein